MIFALPFDLHPSTIFQMYYQLESASKTSESLYISDSVVYNTIVNSTRYYITVYPPQF